MRFYITRDDKRIGFVEWRFTDQKDALGELVRVSLPDDQPLARQIEKQLRSNGASDDPIFVIGGIMPDDASPYLEAISVAIEMAIEEDTDMAYELPSGAVFSLPYAEGQVR